MNKRKTGRTLSRTSDQRLALKRTMLTSLILHKKITTTLAKAKELRPFAEKMITRAKKTSVKAKDQAVLRLLQKDLAKKAVNGLIMIAEKFAAREGGYTRIIKLAPRKSDGAKMAVIEWVERELLENEEDKVGAKKVSKKDKQEMKKDPSVKVAEGRQEEEVSKKTNSASTEASEAKKDKKQA